MKLSNAVGVISGTDDVSDVNVAPSIGGGLYT